MELQSLAVRALVAILVLGGVVSFGWYRGNTSAHKDCDLARAASVARAIDQERATAKQDAEISGAFETTRTQIVTKYKTIEKEVTREIPANCAQCRVTPAALSLLNSAIAGNPVTTPPTPGELNKPLRTPKPFADGDIPRTGGYDHTAIRKTL